MEVSQESSLVIIGGWNANILLNHQWLSKYLFPEQTEFRVELPFGPSFPGPPQISTDDIKIALVGPKLSFTPLKPNPELLERIEDLGIKIADYLPHTPVTAVGINFSFSIASADCIAPLYFKQASSTIEDILGDFGLIVGQMHQCTISLDYCALNLSVRQHNKGRQVYEFNFHHEVSSLADYKELIAEHPISEYATKSRLILTTIIEDSENESKIQDTNT